MTEPAPATVRLWDPLVRLCHWSLAIAFFANWFFTEEGEDWHQWLGYWAGAAALLRVGWGFVATGAAAWRDCLPTPARIAAQLRALRGREPERHLGHSALGALVMMLMLGSMLMLALTGFLMEEIDYFWGDERLEDIHALLADALAALVAVHLLAAVAESIRLRENLPLSMITGRRRVPPG